jgi:hypothetical protein
MEKQLDAVGVIVPDYPWLNIDDTRGRSFIAGEYVTSFGVKLLLAL